MREAGEEKQEEIAEKRRLQRGAVQSEGAQVRERREPRQEREEETGDGESRR